MQERAANTENEEKKRGRKQKREGGRKRRFKHRGVGGVCRREGGVGKMKTPHLKKVQGDEEAECV